MVIINNLDDITTPYRNAVVTIGNFDGVHKGHQALFRQVRLQAEKIGGTAVAITFEPHPMRVLKKEGYPPHITRYDQKLELLSQTDIDVLICIPFTIEFSEITAQSFVEDMLLQKIGMKSIIVGKDYSFGKNREGNIGFLQTASAGFGFEVIVVDWEYNDAGKHERISSTRIREIVMQGRVAEAKNLLGRYYQIRGKVVGGRNRGGKLLGFPTANIRLHDELCPKTGVYAVTVECSVGNFMGVANIGYSPTFDDHVFTVEVHILDFNENIYDQSIRVNFIDRLRDERKFSNITELSNQIKKDIEKARMIPA
ncbi:MAG: bifunctional riboflavin kinase/FAD synthetase [Desulfobacteraceae bacterium]|nr:MAG: bifunctional riboflavin kinase/FAD synthetase [Desulfobacteraceae bacterium]